MIKNSNFERERVEELAGRNKSDPTLMEKLLRALHLLERLREEQLEFIFKGGTALILVLQEPRRLSIDVDILTEEGPERIQDLLERVVEASEFSRWKKNEREGSKVPKEHYKVFYPCVDRGRGTEDHILLDVQYDRSPYGEAINEFPIDVPFAEQEGDPLFVHTPLKEALLGDKLTAFAPNTTGVPYGVEKALDIAKQLHDIGHLFDELERMDMVKTVYEEVVKMELAYRGSDSDRSEVLEDTFQTALLVGSRGRNGKGDFDELKDGFGALKSHLLSQSFSLEKAIGPAARAAYAAALIQEDEGSFERYSGPEDVRDHSIENPTYSKLNKIKKTDPEAFFYWYKALELKELL